MKTKGPQAVQGMKKDDTDLETGKSCTVCPGSSDPFYIASLLYKMGHYFLDMLYKTLPLTKFHMENAAINQNITFSKM